MYLRFFKLLYFMPDEYVQPWINNDYLLTYLPTYLLVRDRE